MLPTEKFFVPREEILKLTVGSFEHRAAQVEAALKETKLQLLGTFDGYAIGLGEDGKIYRVAYESSATGEIRLNEKEKAQMDGPKVYAREALPSYLRKEAREAADLYLKGFIKKAQEKIERLSKVVEANAVYSDDQIVDAFVASLNGNSQWKQQFGAKTEEELKKTLGESYNEIDSNKLQPKFSKLYDGSLSGEELENYRVLVVESFGKLTEKMKAVHDQVLTSVAQVHEVLGKVSESQRETVAAFGAFVEDLLADLARTQRGLAETLQGADGVAALGRLFDALTEDLLRYEVAGGFVVRMTTQLAQASR